MTAIILQSIEELLPNGLFGSQTLTLTGSCPDYDATQTLFRTLEAAAADMGGLGVMRTFGSITITGPTVRLRLFQNSETFLDVARAFSGRSAVRAVA